MATIDELDEALEKYHQALGEFVKGNPEPAKGLWSHRDDVTLANPFGLPARGWEQVAATMEHASSNFRDGEDLHCEVRDSRARLHGVDRAGKGQGRRKGGYHPNRS